MKKRTAVNILFSMIMCLLLFNMFLNKRGETWGQNGLWEMVMDEIDGIVLMEGEQIRDEVVDVWVEERKKIALTFDDGPHPVYTPMLLDGLKERGVKATFFVTGEHVVKRGEIIERMHEEGHLIGNHTYSHMRLEKNNREKFKEELIQTNEVIEEIIGEDVIFVRPPYGSWDRTFEEELNMFPVMWNIDPLDWCSDDAKCIADEVTSKVKENSIILLHDFYEPSVKAALMIIDELLEEGYEFVTVDEILLD